MSPFTRIIGVFCAFLLAGSALSDDQMVLSTTLKNLRVGIIGAGSGGSSTAYYLSKFAHEAGINTSITVFERNAYVGGRSTTVNVWNDPSYPIELGASIFVEVNHNLVNAVKEFGLETTESFAERPQESEDSLGIWDGEKFVYTQSSRNSGWWNNARLLWKYGLAPVYAQRLAKSNVGKFLGFYDKLFPFSSISQAVLDAGLDPATSSTGEAFLKANGLLGPFATDIIQASTRVNYASNLGSIHGLETLVCLSTDGAMSVVGGNWRIFDGMVKKSGAELKLNTTVTGLEKKGDKYLVKSGKDVDEFDIVVLAAPQQFAKITLPPSARIPETIPYVTLHVTLFSSPFKLSPGYFNLPESSSAPEIILTTLPNGETEGSGITDFNSISVLQTAVNPKTGQKEYVYKIFSPEKYPDEKIHALLQGNVITWIYRKVWRPYPHEYPRVTFEEPQLDENLWYTSGIESFISTMETSSLMGMNVARLIVDQEMGGKALETERERKELRRRSKL